MKGDVICLLLINSFSAIGYSLVAPLFPILGSDYKISETVLGWLISSFALTCFIFTSFVPYLISKFGRKNLLYIATLLEAICTFCYGLLEFSPSYFSLIFITIILRIFHGIGSGINGTITYSLANSVCDKSEVQMALGYLELSWSAGVAIGPILASFFYALGGYKLTFLICGIIFLLSTLFVKKLTVTDVDYINATNDAKQKESLINLSTGADDKEQSSNVGNFIQYFFHLEIIIGLIVVIIILNSNTFFMPSLTNHLTKNYNLSVSVSSLFFAVVMVSYFLSLQVLDKIIDKLGYFGASAFGLLLIFLGALMIYPINPLPQSWVYIIVGLSFVGAAGACINVPAILILSEVLKKHYRNLNEFAINDLASALYNIGVNIGDFLGPLVGGCISNNYGFKSSCIFTSLFSLFFMIFYILYYGKVIVQDVYKKYNESKGKNELIEDDIVKGSINKKNNIDNKININNIESNL